LPGADVVVGGGALIVASIGPWDALDAAVAEAARAAADDVDEIAGTLVEIPVMYDGPDLDDVAAAIGTTRDEVIARHLAPTYTAELVGFLPGFAYLGGGDPSLALPRRATPRVRVPAGSVAIAAGFSGVYPFASPGGWHLLGRAGVTMFDPYRATPALVAAGDRVRFVEADVAPLSAPLSIQANLSRGLVVERAPALATVQDRGRAGRLAEGIPPGGPLDHAAMLAANFAVGNDAGDAAIEIPLGTLEVRARGEVRVSIDGEAPRTLADGEALTVPRGERAVRYLAVEGGVDAPFVLGSRATLIPAGIGRPLRRGDVVGACAPRGRSAVRGPGAPPAPGAVVTLEIAPGPHVDRFPDGAEEALLGAERVVSRHGDRVGVRLEGAPLLAPRPLLLPVPMVRGAIEVPPDGSLLVLGPDHPTTGGYPVIGVLTRQGQAVLARCGPGTRVRFMAG
jgi:KipI family sensor histidine kinase inhibitor